MAATSPATNSALTADPNLAQLTPTQAIALNMDRLKFIASVLQGVPNSWGDTRISLDPSKWIAEGREARNGYIEQMRIAGFAGWKISTMPLEIVIGSNDPLQALIVAALGTYAEEERQAARAANPAFSRPNTATDARTAALQKAVEEATPRPFPPQTLADSLAYNDQRLAELRAGKP